MEVYVDLLFVVNLGLNCWALWLVATLVGQRLRLRNLLLSGTLGAIYGLGMVTPWAGQIGHPICKLLLAVCMTQIAFRPLLAIRLIRFTSLFLLVSFTTAGCVLGVYSLLQAGGLQGSTLAYGQLPFWVLIFAVLGLGLGSQRVISLTESRLVHVANQATLQFELEGQTICLTGLVDSGNQLADPLGGRPVAIVSLEVIAGLLPEKLVSLALSDQPFLQRMDGLSEHAWAGRVRFIPFHSVGQKAGVLLGFRVDDVLVSNQSGVREVQNVVLGLSPYPLCEQNEYQALIPLRLVPATAKSTQEVRS